MNENDRPLLYIIRIKPPTALLYNTIEINVFMEEKELINSTIPKDNTYPFFVLAFGKKLGLVIETKNLTELDIRMLCQKISDRLQLELEEFKKK